MNGRYVVLWICLFLLCACAFVFEGGSVSAMDISKRMFLLLLSSDLFISVISWRHVAYCLINIRFCSVTQH
jgi:hypothetical protein